MLIAARNGFLAGGGWKNPYVTDGLVAMWDGEWNAVGGKHDASATVWKDLSGNNNFTLETGQGSFTDKAYVCNNIANFAGSANYANATFFEIVSGSRYSNAAGPVISLHKPYGVLIYRDRNRGVTLYTGSTGCANSLLFNDGQNHTFSVDYGSGNKPTVYVDGTMRTYTVSGSWDSDFVMPNYMQIGGMYNYNHNARLYSIRAYSRALTAAEVAANYAVDKARFNLPQPAGNM